MTSDRDRDLGGEPACWAHLLDDLDAPPDSAGVGGRLDPDAPVDLVDVGGRLDPDAPVDLVDVGGRLDPGDLDDSAEGAAGPTSATRPTWTTSTGGQV